MKSRNLMAILLLAGVVVLSGCTAYQYQQTSTPAGTPASTPPAAPQQQNNTTTTPPAQPAPNTTQPNATTSQPPAQPKTYSVSIVSYSFSPSTMTINAGDTVVWTNNDYYGHTVTSDSGTELSSSALSQGGTYSHTFNQAGTFSYHCSIHSYMKGTVVVQ